MRVILLEDVKKQGKKGDIKTVKDGYGMYLINNHLAIKETEGSIDVLKKQNKEKAEKEAKKLEEAKILKEKLEKIKLTFKVKTGQNDQVFGTKGNASSLPQSERRPESSDDLRGRTCLSSGYTEQFPAVSETQRGLYAGYDHKHKRDDVCYGNDADRTGGSGKERHVF